MTAAIYILCSRFRGFQTREPNEKVSLASISEVTQVSEGTIVPTYKELKADMVLSQLS